MRWHLSTLGYLVTVFSVASAMAAEPAGTAKKKYVPSVAEVRAAVLDHFQKLPDFQRGDLITRDQVEPLLAKLQKMGLPLPDANKILKQVPAKNDFLPQQLATPNGRKFMRMISRYPDAYDRLDRLSRLPHGEQTIRDLVRGPGGDKMIQYMTTAKGGRELGKMLSNCPRAGNFNAATSRLYTVDRLLSRLEPAEK
jgi:hypothetical protein